MIAEPYGTDYSALAQAAMHGDEIAMNTLLASVRPRLYAYALRICKFNTIAEDAIQDAFIHAYLHLGQLRQPSAFYPWIRSIVRRSAWRSLSERDTSYCNSYSLAVAKEPREESYESIFEAHIMHASVHEAIAKLSDTLRMPVLLRYFSDHQEYNEIAEILSIPVGTVRSRLHEAKKQLKSLWTGGVDIPAALARDAQEWNDFYRTIWSTLYDAAETRQRLASHFANDVDLHFTSGTRARGRHLVEHEIEADMQYGSRSVPSSVFNLGNIGIVECMNVNSAEYPDRCPPRTTFILHRRQSQTVLLQLHHASKTLEQASVLVPG